MGHFDGYQSTDRTKKTCEIVRLEREKIRLPVRKNVWPFCRQNEEPTNVEIRLLGTLVGWKNPGISRQMGE